MATEMSPISQGLSTYRTQIIEEKTKAFKDIQAEKKRGRMEVVAYMICLTIVAGIIVGFLIFMSHSPLPLNTKIFSIIGGLVFSSFVPIVMVSGMIQEIAKTKLRNKQRMKTFTDWAQGLNQEIFKKMLESNGAEVRDTLKLMHGEHFTGFATFVEQRTASDKNNEILSAIREHEDYRT